MSERAYEITWSPTARRALAKLPENVGTAVAEFIYGPPARKPHRVCRALRFELEGMHSARRGGFRIVYRITEDVTILAIEHRVDVYGPR